MVWFFVFKQKTAYEMRISDWSSDVCSSDLLGVLVLRGEAVVDDLLVRGVLLELGRGFAQIRRIPEALPDALGLVHDLLLFEQLGEQDVERDDRHDDENAERPLRNQAAFAKSGDEAVRIGARGGPGPQGKTGPGHLAVFHSRSKFQT